jgi:UPF0755 protein
MRSIFDKATLLMERTTKGKQRGKKQQWLRYVLMLVAGIVLIALYFLFGPNTGAFTNGEYLYIRTGSDYEIVKTALKEGGFIRDMNSFDLLAKKANYPQNIHPGKYHISWGMSNYSIVRLLRSGRQTPVKLVVGKVRLKQDFIRLLSTNLEADADVLRRMFADTAYLGQFGLDTSTVLCGVMPDTYEFYWNTSADKAFRKIVKSYSRFWTEERKAKARAKNLTPQQAIILASIVEEETNKNSEKPTIASVYLNRREKGMKLQADPTAKFAYGDFTLRRITSVQTGLASPYNTYYVSGLPIGPICTPSAASINAVLDAPKTAYLYFCAGGNGGHLFAATYDEHLKNAARYHQMLNDRNIH